MIKRMVSAMTEERKKNLKIEYKNNNPHNISSSLQKNCSYWVGVEISNDQM